VDGAQSTTRTIGTSRLGLTPNDAHFVQLTGNAREQLGDVNAGHARGNGRQFAANFHRCVFS
jgi:hypothetical protein